MRRTRQIATATVLATTAALGGLAMLPSVAAAAPPATAAVTHGGNDGPGSFRAAVEAANADASISQIRFDRSLEVDLTAPVEFTGNQDLTVDGRGSTISGASAAPAATFDDGLFVSSGATADLVVEDLAFDDSFGNGVAVFVPADVDDQVSLTLDRVSITGSQFHGLWWDGQAYDGFNTDDVPHPNCTDPHFVDANTTMVRVLPRAVAQGCRCRFVTDVFWGMRIEVTHHPECPALEALSVGAELNN